VKGSSITLNFHSSWGEETYSKAKKLFKISVTYFAAWPHVQVNLHANAKAWVFADRFCSHFNARGFTSRSKSWIQVRSNNVYHHFCFLSPKSCFKSVICHQKLLESAPIFMYSWLLCVGRKTSSPESFEDSVLFDPPFWGHLNIDLYFPCLF